jgi:acetyl-CoA carboxylase biotin carboxyl carrier protein
MLGVFYRRPSPGAEPFVQPGQQLLPDTTIGIIEIMKLMNPVVAGIAGTLTAFEVEDGTSVQFGQTLARVEPGTP